MKSAVPRFPARYPEMALDLVTEGRLVDIVAAGIAGLSRPPQVAAHAGRPQGPCLHQHAQ
jgi:hypothetical protein